MGRNRMRPDNRTRPASGVQPGNGPLFEETSTAAEAGDHGGEAAILTAAPVAAARRRLGWMPVALVGGLVAAGLWGAWVTKNLLGREDMPPMARVQLSAIVGEYVQAQARSATPPEQVTAETRAFMAEIQRNLEARGASGQIVLVGEAVLAGDVPDITAALRRQVYAKVRMPQAAALGGANEVLGAMRSAMSDPAALASSGGAGGQGRAPGN